MGRTLRGSRRCDKLDRLHPSGGPGIVERPLKMVPAQVLLQNCEPCLRASSHRSNRLKRRRQRCESRIAIDTGSNVGVDPELLAEPHRRYFAEDRRGGVWAAGGAVPRIGGHDPEV